MDQVSSPHRQQRPGRERKGLILGVALLVIGALTWVAIAALLLSGGDDDSPSGSDDAALAASEQPTLAAIAVTATATPLPTDTPAPSATPSLTPTAAPSATPTNSPTETPVMSEAAAAEATNPTAAPDADPSEVPPAAVGTGAADQPASAGEASPPQATATTCAPPSDWEAYTVRPDDTWFAFSLGAREAGGVTLTVDELMAANCLDRRWLKVEETIYLPPGAADNAPPSVAVAPSGGQVSGARGPRTPNCPCTISIRPGWRREQIADAIDASATMFTGADFLAVTGPGASAPFDFVMERPGGTSLEGFLYPGTYVVENETTAEGFRDMLLSAFGANVTPQIRADAAAQGVTFYQALIIASITQRESYTPETQKLIASIFYNRLRDGNRMASTVPVSYALGGPGNWWPRVNGSNMNVDSPYNTYTRPGLPPAPIDNPDINAILAAVYPPQTNYYYHSRTCDGQAGFFETYEQHLANLRCE